MADISRHSRIRPQIYVRVEFGVSWTPAERPRNHEVTYRSRALRERVPAFPRQVPAPNTNYLSNVPSQHPPRTLRPSHPPHPPHPQVPYDWDMYYGYYAPPLPPPYQSRDPPRQGYEAHRRSSRSDSRSSHERGQSAPPPIGNNPWDVNIRQQPQDAYQTGPTGQRRSPEVWKALSEGPAPFRLGGDDSLPWGAWSVPYGYDPDAHPQDDSDEHDQPSSSRSPPPARQSSSNVVSATSPTEVSTFSPGPSGPGLRHDDPGRAHELSTLGAALMTVDNGFENQWWYQGRREAVDTGDVVGETVQNPQRFSRNSLGWAVASTASNRLERTSTTTDVVVSPLPSFASPASVATYPTLARSLSTRSDELFFTERGRSPQPA